MTAIKPNVRFVKSILNQHKGNLFDIAKYKDDRVIVNALSDAFECKNIEFNIKRRSSNDMTNYFWKRTAIHSAEYSDAGIEIYLTRGLHRQFLNDFQFVDFKNVLSILVEHEFIHKEQFKRAGSIYCAWGETSEDYFSDPQEAEPFAAEIVGELKLCGYNRKEILGFFKEDSEMLAFSSRYDQLKTILDQPHHRTALNNIKKKVIARLL